MKTRIVLPVMLSMMVAGVLSALPLCASAQQLDSYGALFKAVMENSLNSSITAPGDKIQAVLSEPNCYQQTCLPAGTKITGVITEVKAGKSFSLSPAIFFQVTKVSFPDGVVTQVTAAGKASHLYDEATLAKKGVDKEYSVVGAAGTAISLVNPVAGIATRVAAGSFVGVENQSGSNAVESAAKGVYNSTAIPKVLNFVQEKPALEYIPGQVVFFQMSPENAQAVFSEYANRQSSNMPQEIMQ